MSRIDEALNRAAGIVPRREQATAFALDDYVLERQPEPESPRVNVEEEPAQVEEPAEEVALAPVPRPVAAEPPPVEKPVAVPRPVSGGTVVSLRAKTAAEPQPAYDPRVTASLPRYRKLAGILHHAHNERAVKLVTLTSALDEEGKARSAVSLARVLSEAHGLKVLVIDADLRHPTVHQLVGARNENGVADVLSSERRQFPLFPVTPVFHLMPAGHSGGHTVGDWVTERMRALLEECAVTYDMVLVNAPPLSSPFKPLILARLTQGVVFVMGASTPFPAVEKAMSELGRDFVLGTVLNGLDEMLDTPVVN